MKYSILHISDLHKGKDSDLNNLFVSLERDCENYTHEGILKPSIIVVSGDVVNGAEGKNAINEIKQQYQEVAEFLNRLVGLFLDGDKRRLIIVPGNHDICRTYSMASMAPSQEDKSKDVDAMKRMNPEIRWSWRDFRFYRVVHSSVYESRFSLFKEFYNTYYDGIRTIGGNPECYSDIVDLPEYGISFVLFNSCYRLDHLNFSGSICPSAVTVLDRSLNDLYKQGRLLVAVWHHHTMGLPPETNYLDYRILQTMLACHINIGLYGHQHKSQVINNYSDIDEEQPMLLVCSGSLYGQRKELATGYSRQYNLITIENSNHTAKVSVSVRTDIQVDYDIPSWATGTIGKKARKSYDTEVPLYKPSVTESLMRIDDVARKTGDFNKAVKELVALGREVPRYDDYLDEYLSKANLSADDVIGLITDPQTETQAMVLINAAINKNDPEIKARIKALPIINSGSTILKELVSNL